MIVLEGRISCKGEVKLEIHEVCESWGLCRVSLAPRAGYKRATVGYRNSGGQWPLIY